jgi:hypothetical protein
MRSGGLKPLASACRRIWPTGRVVEISSGIAIAANLAVAACELRGGSDECAATRCRPAEADSAGNGNC